MEVQIKAKSSKPDNSYTVTFIHENNLLKVFCECPAGIYGKFCKHKWQLLSGNAQMLFEETEQRKLDTVSKWAQERNCLGLYSAINDLESQLKELKKRIVAEKKGIERKFKEGF